MIRKTIIVYFCIIFACVFGDDLFDAIREGKEAEVINLIKLKRQSNKEKRPRSRSIFDINAFNFERYCTPLIYALKYNQENIAKILIENGAKLGCFEVEADIAVRSDMVNLVEYLLEKGLMNININGPNSTILHAAVQHNDARMTKLLCEKGFSLEAKNYLSHTALHEALIYKGNDRVGVVRFLLESGANVNALTDNLETPLHFAAKLQNFSENKIILDLLLAKGAQVNARNFQKYTPLLTAAEYGNVEGFCVLLANGADIHARDYHQRSILHHTKSTIIVKLAKSYGSDMNAKDIDGNTPILHAASNIDEDMIRILVKCGADINAVNNRMEMVLHSAVVNYYSVPVSFLKFLLFCGADVNLPAKVGNPLKWKTCRHKVIIRTMLVEAGMQFSREDFADVLSKNWPKRIVAKMSQMDQYKNFQEFATTINKLFFNRPPKSNLRNALFYYENKRAYAMYKIMKQIYGKKEAAAGLEQRKFHFFDRIVMVITEGTYLKTLPLDLAFDILLTSNFYASELDKLAWNLGLASCNVNSSEDEVQVLIMEFICSDFITKTAEF